MSCLLGIWFLFESQILNSRYVCGCFYFILYDDDDAFYLPRQLIVVLTSGLNENDVLSGFCLWEILSCKFLVELHNLTVELFSCG